MQSALVVTWTHPVAGREQKALAYAAEVNEFWGAKAAAGLCAEPQWFFAESGVGMWIVTGERDALMQLHDSDEARMLLMKGELFIEAFRAEFYYTGDSA